MVDRETSLTTICILGAECTGKTTLGKQLQTALEIHHRSTVLLPETLRSWCESQGRTPSSFEQSQIIELQIETIRECQKSMELDFLLVDSAPLATALYSMIYFDDQSLIEQAVNFHRAHFDLSLIIRPEFPWIPDPLKFMRDSPIAQSAFDRLLVDVLSRSDPCFESVHFIEGNESQRVQRSLAAIFSAH